MATKTEAQFVILKNVRLSFPALFKPEASQDGGGPPRYKSAFLLDPKDEANKAQILEMKAEIDRMWAGLTKKPDAKAPREKTCLKKDGTWDGYDGMWYISAARAESQGKPVLLGRRKDALPDNSTELYAGCYVNAKIRLYAHEHPKSGKRINASIEVVQKAREGTPFGAGPASIDDMPDVDDTPDSADLDEMGGDEDGL
jgi:hypothetical protein